MEVVALASEEHAIETSLRQMRNTFGRLTIPIALYRDGPVLGPVENVIEELEEQLLRCKSLEGSRYAVPFEAELQRLVK